MIIRTLGSLTPRVCTRMTLCMNLIAANFTPLGACCDHTKSNIFILACDSESQCTGGPRLMHLTRTVSRHVSWCSGTKIETYSCRNSKGYTVANVCTATFTVLTLRSFKIPAKTSRDCVATNNALSTGDLYNSNVKRTLGACLSRQR